MLETIIAIASGANVLFDLYRNISSIGRSEELSDRYLDYIASELGQLRLKVERLSDNILYLPTVEGVKDLNRKYQNRVQDLQEVKTYLNPIQQSLGQDIISSAMISTPERLLEAMKKSPWEVFIDIRPIHRLEPHRDPSLTPVIFQDDGITYSGWTKRGGLSGFYDCQHNELWLPNSLRNNKAIRTDSQTLASSTSTNTDISRKDLQESPSSVHSSKSIKSQESENVVNLHISLRRPNLRIPAFDISFFRSTWRFLLKPKTEVWIRRSVSFLEYAAAIIILIFAGIENNRYPLHPATFFGLTVVITILLFSATLLWKRPHRRNSNRLRLLPRFIAMLHIIVGLFYGIFLFGLPFLYAGISLWRE